MIVRAVLNKDCAEIAAIYSHYIANSVITFEEQEVQSDDILERIEEARQAELPYLVAEDDDRVLGYAYASKWKGRCAYRYTAEVTVYLHQDAGGRGIGSRLYEELFAELEEKNYHMAIAGISLPNEASIALHEKFAMKKVAHFEEVGYKFNRWVDVGYWQGPVKLV